MKSYFPIQYEDSVAYVDMCFKTTKQCGVWFWILIWYLKNYDRACY